MSPPHLSILSRSGDSTLNPEILSRHASEKEDAPCCFEYSINSINP